MATEIYPGDDSLWGTIDYVDKLCDYAYFVETPSHGGILIAANSPLGKEFSDAAWDAAQGFKTWLCYEEDLDYIIAIYELDRLGCQIDNRDSNWDSYTRDPDEWKDQNLGLLQQYYPRYYEFLMG